MKRLSGEEMREGVISAQESAEQVFSSAEEAKSARERAAEGQMRAAFGHRVEAQGQIAQAQLRRAYQDGPQRVTTAVERVSNSPIPISSQHFRMVRDWDTREQEENDAKRTDQRPDSELRRDSASNCPRRQ